MKTFYAFLITNGVLAAALMGWWYWQAYPKRVVVTPLPEKLVAVAPPPVALKIEELAACNRLVSEYDIPKPPPEAPKRHVYQMAVGEIGFVNGGYSDHGAAFINSHSEVFAEQDRYNGTKIQRVKNGVLVDCDSADLTFLINNGNGTSGRIWSAEDLLPVIGHMNPQRNMRPDGKNKL